MCFYKDVFRLILGGGGLFGDSLFVEVSLRVFSFYWRRVQVWDQRLFTIPKVHETVKNVDENVSH